VPKKRPPRRTPGGSRPARPGNAPAARRQAGTRAGRTTPTPSTGFRGTVERKSYPILLRLAEGPKLVPPLLLLAVAAAGLLLPPPAGPICLGIVALFVAWLTYLSWPATATGARALRLVLLILIVGGALGPAILP
jgi:hypothetical protein